MVSSTLLAATIALAAAPANAFTSVVCNNNNHHASAAAVFGGNNIVGGPAALYSTATDDASAQALSDYMAKSHEEKLRAVQAVEEKKNSEIAALKTEIEQLKTSSGLATTTSAAPLATSSSEAEAKLASYQSFMAEYIVNAQNQKLLAVKEAELKAETKFQARLEKLFEASGMALPEGAGGSAGTAAVVVETTSFQKRNAEIISAAAAGKSRWGNMEIERAIEQAKSAPAASAAAVVPPPEVAATVFERRNAQVVAAAGAGKSRWGSMEVERAMAANSSSSGGGDATAAVVVEEKTAAPVSLADRVNLGARLLGA